MIHYLASSDFWIQARPVFWLVGVGVCIGLIATIGYWTRKYGDRRYDDGVKAGYMTRQAEEVLKQHNARF